MTLQQRQRLEQRLRIWREAHPDAASLRAAYRQRVLSLTIESMALERQPVDAIRLAQLLTRPSR
ncbi:MAG: hypothetical protein N3C63_06010 [Rhodocyclaceae bacterium]|nr:hypothetical protein [Rhodocyclaceae bacterium]